MDLIHLDQDRDNLQALVNTVPNIQVPWKAENFLIMWVTFSFSTRTLHHGVS